MHANTYPHTEIATQSLASKGQHMVRTQTKPQHVMDSGLMTVASRDDVLLYMLSHDHLMPAQTVLT